MQETEGGGMREREREARPRSLGPHARDGEEREGKRRIDTANSWAPGRPPTQPAERAASTVSWLGTGSRVCRYGLHRWATRPRKRPLGMWERATPLPRPSHAMPCHSLRVPYMGAKG